MSAKHIRVIGDLVRFKASLRLDCRNCAAARTMTGPEAVTAFGSCPLEAAEERLRCSRCGSRSGRLTVLPPV
jgi:hypothetical protein